MMSDNGHRDQYLADPLLSVEFQVLCYALLMHFCISSSWLFYVVVTTRPILQTSERGTQELGPGPVSLCWSHARAWGFSHHTILLSSML